MAYIDFHPTIHEIGDSAFIKAYIEGTLTGFSDRSLKTIGSRGLAGLSMVSLDLPNLEHSNSEALIDNSLPTLVLPMLDDAGTGLASKMPNLQMVCLPVCQLLYGGAFQNCASLTTVILGNHRGTTFNGANIFAGTPVEAGSGYIYVRKSLVDTFKNATNASVYAAQFRAIEDYPEIMEILKEAEGS